MENQGVKMHNIKSKIQSYEKNKEKFTQKVDFCIRNWNWEQLN